MEFSGHQGGIRHVNYFENDQRLVSCSDDKTLRVCDIASGKVNNNLLIKLLKCMFKFNDSRSVY